MRRALLALSVTGTLSGLFGIASAAPGSIALQSRKPLSFLLINPSGNIANTSSSEIIRIVTDLFERHTDLQPTILDAKSVASCKGQLGCIVRIVRTDYNRAEYLLANGTVAPYKEHRRYLRKRKVQYPKHLLVLSGLSLGASDRLSVTLVDTDTALEYYHQAFRNREDWERDTEAKINEYAVVGGTKWGELKSEADARSFLETHFNTALRKHFEATGSWEPFGQIEIESQVAGQAISLNKETVGATSSGLTRILSVPAGDYELKLEHPNYSDYATSFKVERGKLVRVKAVVQQNASPVASGLRQGLLWGGVGVGVIGAVVAGVALGTQDSSVQTFCPGAESGCSGSRFTRTGYNPDLAPTFDDNVNSGAVLLAPLGYSLAIVGATWSLGTWLLGDDDDLPWIQLVAGLALGGLSYGLSVALDGPNPYSSMAN